MFRKLLILLVVGGVMLSLNIGIQPFSGNSISAQDGKYTTHYGGFFSLDYPVGWATTEVETLDANLVLFSPEAINFFGEPTFANLVNDEALQAALLERPVAGLWIARIQNDNLVSSLRHEAEMRPDWAGNTTREVIENSLATLDIYKSERQTQTIINGYEAVEALGVLAGQGRFADHLFGVYTVMFRDDENLYWFVGTALLDEFEAVQPDFETMAHTIIGRADDVRADELMPPAGMEFISTEGTGYTLDYPADWATDTSENFDVAWIVTSPADIFLHGDPAELEIISENEDILQAMPHNPVAGVVRLELDDNTSAEDIYLVSLLEDMATQVNVRKIDMQRHTRLNGADAVEASAIIQGEGQLAGQNFGIYILLAKTNVAVYYFVGVTPEADFATYQPVFRYMAHRLEFRGFPVTSALDDNAPPPRPEPSQPAVDPTKPEFSVYAGIPHDVSVRNPAWVVEPDPTVADGVVRGILADGTPFIGSLDAPIVFAEFSDFACPHCANFEPEIHKLIEAYVRTGQLRIEFRPLTFVGREYSITATKGALCAAQQGAFWEFHTMLFALQHNEGAPSFTDTAMLDIGTALGLDNDALQACMNSNQSDITLAAVAQLQAETDVNATPTLIYRGNASTAWQRFIDGSGNVTFTLPFEELGQIISAYNN